MDQQLSAKRIVQLNVLRGQMAHTEKPKAVVVNANSRLVPASAMGPSRTRLIAKRVLGEEVKVFQNAGSIRTDTSVNGDAKLKGLKYFSKVVLKLLEEKKEATYSEISQELVKIHFDGMPDLKNGEDLRTARNIERRAYDALNVLIAADLISRDNKTLRFIGNPSVNSEKEVRKLSENLIKRREEVNRKKEELRNLVCQMVSYKTLVERNRALEHVYGRPRSGSIIHSPTIFITTNKYTNVDVAVAEDKSEYLFQFDGPFELHDDVDLMKRIGLARGMENEHVSLENIEKIKSYVPEALRPFINEIVNTNQWPGEAFQAKRQELRRFLPIKSNKQAPAP
ncbi:hypothetical protein QR680_019252 [Steinernema hermaphroditum]|uniref:E2F/DP family winged-helix DNA-binding domain-containing protein n=1 Tax=Steinernema hermaphroditum TaxID=289476 RepID=A0AA39LSD4_9BILA|nr:hypothetical protein QR680_019252 [Steinernema hermaphroditum]